MSSSYTRPSVALKSRFQESGPVVSVLLQLVSQLDPTLVMRMATCHELEPLQKLE